MSNKKKKVNNKKRKVSKEMEKMETWKCPKCETVSDAEKEKGTVCHEEEATELSFSETEQLSDETEQPSSEIEQQPDETEQPSSEKEQQSDETEQPSSEIEQQLDEKEQQSSETEQQPDEKEQQSDEKEQQSSETEQQFNEIEHEIEQQPDEKEQQPNEAEQQPNEIKQKADEKKQPPKKKEKSEKESSEEKSDPLMLKKVFVLGTVALIVFIIVMAAVIGRGSNDEPPVEEVEVTEEVEQEEEIAEEPEEVEIPEGVLSNDYVVILQYKGLELFVREMPEITDDDVEFMIQAELQGQSITEEVTDRPAEDGDTVLIDFAGSVDGEYFDGGTSEGFELRLGSGMFIGPYGDYEGFEEQIIGHEIGDNFDITIQFPATYHSPDLAGEVANFNITIHGITETVTPELTDEWVQENSEGATTVEEYKQEIREMLYETTKVNILYMQQQEVFEALMEQVVIIEVPEWAIEEEAMKLKTLFRNIAASEGITLEEYLLAVIGMDEESFNIEVLRVAEELAPRMLAISLIIEYENIEPTQEEIINRTEVLARLQGMESVEEYIEVLGEDYVNETMVLLSVTEFLIEHAATH